MRCENKPLLQDDPRFFQDITSTAVEVGLIGGRYLNSRGLQLQRSREPLFGLLFDE